MTDSAPRPPPPIRPGPRPLPLHLATALLSLGGSETGWRLSKPGSPPSKPDPGPPDAGRPDAVPRRRDLTPEAAPPRPDEAVRVLSAAAERWAGLSAAMDRLRDEIDIVLAARVAAPGSATSAGTADVTGGVAAPDAPFVAALRRETARRLDRMAAGILAYRGSPVRRDLPEAPEVWSEGETRLLDYGVFGPADSGPAEPRPGAHRRRAARDRRPAVLIVPSLVNRWHVLDLSAEKSLVRAMAAAGFRPFLVDWGTPGDAERGFDCTGYVLRLERALDAARRLGRGRIAVVGYCMGGLLALALAQRRPRAVGGLALLATPWDFHADRAGQAFLAAAGPSLVAGAEAAGELPVDVLQMLFWSLDPWQGQRKFERFGRLGAASREAAEFVLLEDWLNDGAPLTAPVARDCIAGWYGENLPGRNLWRIDGRLVLPGKLRLPTLLAIPSGDRIVPPESAAALAGAPPRGIPGATRLDLPLGHIGMVVSGKAPGLCWRPLFGWLAASARR